MTLLPKSLRIMTTAFITGLTIMVFELIAGKMEGAVLGNSITTWAAVLGTVTLGLAAGYFMGGRLSALANPEKWIRNGLLFSSIHIALVMVFSSTLLRVFSENFGPFGAIPFSLLTVFPLNFFLGWISPLLIAAARPAPKKAGQIAGRLLGVSTIGGVLGILGIGFFLLPVLPLIWSIAGLGIGLMLTATLWIPRLGNLPILAVGVVVMTTLWILPGLINKTDPDWVKYRNTGVNGELIVADVHGESGAEMRVLLNNRIGQTLISKRIDCSFWPYVYYISTLAGKRPEGGRALLLGLAGGTIANELSSLGFQTTAVDIDPRTHEVGQNWFDLSDEVRFVADDARHFLNLATPAYEVIVMDLFAGEAQPDHVLSVESMEKAYRLLAPNGLFIINHHGFWEGNALDAQLGIAKGLQQAGFSVAYQLTPGRPESRNTLFIAGKNLDVALASPSRQTPCAIRRAIPKKPEITYLSTQETELAPLFTDDRPRLAYYNREAYASWRAYALQKYVLDLREKGLQLY